MYNEFTKNDIYNEFTREDWELLKNTGIVGTYKGSDIRTVVYCKDCKYWEDIIEYNDEEEILDYSHCKQGIYAGNGKDFFCAFGERE